MWQCDVYSALCLPYSSCLCCVGLHAVWLQWRVELRQEGQLRYGGACQAFHLSLLYSLSISLYCTVQEHLNTEQVVKEQTTQGSERHRAVVT